ncbi:MAG: AIR synthase-related protein, partial [candidate division NC10 bacterium]
RGPATPLAPARRLRLRGRRPMNPLTHRETGVDIDAREDAEMFRAFNMGIGYVAVVPAAKADAAASALREAGETVFRLGEIVRGERGVELAP